MKPGLTRFAIGAITLGAIVAGTAAAPSDARRAERSGDRAFYILPPGNYGGFPTTANSLDQLPLYDGLTPLRGNVTDADIDRHFLPENFKPVGPTQEEFTGRPGLTILYDSYGVPHITGKTRDDVSFGAGWVTARDRGLLLQLGRGPARVAVADVPGINAFGLVTSAQSFVPSAQTEQLLDDQIALILSTYGEKGKQIIADAQAGADGVNAYWAAHNITDPPVGVRDVIAVSAFIGSIFGAGGGAEASNAAFLNKLQTSMGPVAGRQAWEDAMQLDDPESPTTITQRFNYGWRTGGAVTGSPTIDTGSIVSLDPRQTGAPTPTVAAARQATDTGALDPTQPFYPAAGPVPHKQASNFLIVDKSRSATNNSLAVMGPQLGYYYPEIVQQMHLSGPGIEAQGIVVPGLSMYMLIGRTQDYAWSLTSANHDVRDVFVEQLCTTDGSTPTRQSKNYMFNGACTPFNIFDAGTLNGTPITYPTSVHGPVIGTATSNGTPVALTRQRSTFGRDGLNLAALKDMTEGKATTADKFFTAANQFGFTFNWGYASRTQTAYFSSGLLPRRAAGLDRRLPTNGDGSYEWKGYLSRNEHPHSVSGPGGLLLNWNNQSAPGFMHGDDTPYGSVHRVELFDKYPNKVTLANDVSVMNRAATEDGRSLVWPVVSEVLRGSTPPNALDAKVVRLLDRWVSRDAPRLDADNNGLYDEAGPTVMDALWGSIANAVISPVYGPLTQDYNAIRGLGGQSAQSLVEKDLRTLLGKPVKGKLKLRYCGNGSIDACRAALWAAIDQVAANLAATNGSDPGAWRSTASRTGFTPGLIPDTMRTTNRPTFQQVLEFDGTMPRRRR